MREPSIYAKTVTSDGPGARLLFPQRPQGELRAALGGFCAVACAVRRGLDERCAQAHQYARRENTAGFGERSGDNRYYGHKGAKFAPQSEYHNATAGFPTQG